MKQLTTEQINTIKLKLAADGLLNHSKTHSWVTEDGAYDHEEYSLRVFIIDGFCYYVASKMWIESSSKDRLPEWMQAPWGTYPPLPPKPPKK